MSYKDNDSLFDSTRKRIEDILGLFDIKKILPEKYRERYSNSGLLHLDEENLGYTSLHEVYPLLYNLSLSIEDYSNNSKALYKNGMILYLVDGKKVKFFYEKTENKLGNPAAIYNIENKQANFNASIINSMEDENLTILLRFISILNYITYMKK